MSGTCYIELGLQRAQWKGLRRPFSCPLRLTLITFLFFSLYISFIFLHTFLMCSSIIITLLARSPCLFLGF